LQKALQEKQNVLKVVKEWNDKVDEMYKLQAALNAKFQQHNFKTNCGKLNSIKEITGGKLESSKENIGTP
jgi:hypothetical protein